MTTAVFDIFSKKNLKNVLHLLDNRAKLDLRSTQEIFSLFIISSGFKDSNQKLVSFNSMLNILSQI